MDIFLQIFLGTFLLFAGVWLFATAVHSSTRVDDDNPAPDTFVIVVLSVMGSICISASLLTLMIQAVKITGLS